MRELLTPFLLLVAAALACPATALAEGDEDSQEESCPDEEGCGEDGAGFDEQEIDTVTTTEWSFSSDSRAFVESLRKLLLKFPGEVKVSRIRQQDGEFVLQARTRALEGEEVEAFEEKLDKAMENHKGNFTSGSRSSTDIDWEAPFEGEASQD